MSFIITQGFGIPPFTSTLAVSPARIGVGATVRIDWVGTYTRWTTSPPTFQASGSPAEDPGWQLGPAMVTSDTQAYATLRIGETAGTVTWVDSTTGAQTTQEIVSSLAQDVLARGLAQLTGQLTANASQTAMYIRGSTTIQVQATLGSKLRRLNDDLGVVRMEWSDLDILIPATDLVVAGVPLIPQRGDAIILTIAGASQRFEVRPIDKEPAWRWCDPMQTMLRIRTKRVS